MVALQTGRRFVEFSDSRRINLRICGKIPPVLWICFRQASNSKPALRFLIFTILSKNLQVPEEAHEQRQKARVPVKFVVNKDGVLSSVEFLTQTDNAFRKEILRVMGKMPKWKPGLQHGKTVAVYYTIPVIFDMSEN